MHHEGDLLSQAATAAIGRFYPAQEVILRSRPDGIAGPPGGSRLRHYRATLTGFEDTFGPSRLSARLRERLDRWPDD
jgi:hypothetical protein